CCLSGAAPHPQLSSFPTRRSSDLAELAVQRGHVARERAVVRERSAHRGTQRLLLGARHARLGDRGLRLGARIGSRSELRELELPDRKSTRLNSSHVSSSYAVFCLK